MKNRRSIRTTMAKKSKQEPAAEAKDTAEPKASRRKKKDAAAPSLLNGDAETHEPPPETIETVDAPAAEVEAPLPRKRGKKKKETPDAAEVPATDVEAETPVESSAETAPSEEPPVETPGPEGETAEQGSSTEPDVPPAEINWDELARTVE